MYYHVDYYRHPTVNTDGDSLLVPATAKSDIEMLNKATVTAKKRGYAAITIYRCYMSKCERRWKTVVRRHIIS